MDPILLVSPHLDDAVLGAGQFLASYPGAHVATVCTASPAGEHLTSYDRDSGFVTSAQAMTVRRSEDTKALGLLGARPVHLPLLDSQYRDGLPEPHERITAEVDALVEQLRPARLFTVLGVSHPDHVAVREACLEVGERYGLPMVVWEDLPYRVQWPDQAVDTARALSYDQEPTFVGVGPLQRKQRAVHCYLSQAWALSLRCVWVPERFWRVDVWNLSG